ncbi:response regulator [Sphingomonas endophytica]|jgi:CheY-like chemotaxis protein|uniref:CheY-like chemotaxis protein n=1 Tax=Sphingomonas endophytica TaxID=869719 RepID=A0A7X0MMU8_9SPHN|nr:response regulator [Sphingomonas endophytica]MBB5724707.1 CheY-like chemotaxis protein [Sphingomonas endophytica]MBB6503375.1 CheY-like chemotaxis protein [Sphingomonas endophytica]
MTGPLRLLLVDDDPDIRTIVTLALGLDPAMTLVAVGTPDEALAAIAAGPPFDAALLDVTMPVMDGPALLGAVRAIVPDLPVIFMTAHSRAHELVALYAAGARGVIVKPFDPLTLAVQVRALLP